MQKYAVFRVADEIFGIPVEKAMEIMRPQKLFPVPGLPDFLSGVINVRGAVIPLMDLRMRFGVPPSGNRERILIVLFRNEKIAFLVDEIREIITLLPEEISEPPEIFRGFKTEYMIGLGKKDGSVIILLNSDNLLTSEEIIVMKDIIDKMEAVNSENETDEGDGTGES